MFIPGMQMRTLQAANDAASGKLLQNAMKGFGQQPGGTFMWNAPQHGGVFAWNAPQQQGKVFAWNTPQQQGDGFTWNTPPWWPQQSFDPQRQWTSLRERSSVPWGDLPPMPKIDNPYNPYLADQMASTVQDYARQFLEQINPALESQSIATGGYGGDRMNLAKATAASNLQRDLASAIANMQSADWRAGQQYGLKAGELDLNRMLGLGRLSLDQQLGLGQLGLGFGKLGLDRELGLGQLGLGLGKLGLDRELGLGQLGLGFGRLGLDTELGMGQLGLGIGRLGLDTELGRGQLGLGFGRLGLDTELGRGQLGLGFGRLGLERELGLENIGTQRRGQDITRELGLGELGVKSYGAETDRLSAEGRLKLAADDLALREALGRAGIDVNNREIDARLLGNLLQTDLGWGDNYNRYLASMAALMDASGRAAGAPVYASPFSSAIGGGLTLAQLLNLIGG